MENLKFSSANNAFESLAKKIEDEGINHDGTLAIFNVSFTLLNPISNIIHNENRKWKIDYAMSEYDWYRSGYRNPQPVIDAGGKIWGRMVDDKGYVNSNYGSWWLRNNQLKFALNLLRKNPKSRRSIVVHYSPDEATLNEYEKDTPCNVVLNFYTVANTLYMTVFARSIDLIFGFCNDQYCFSRLLQDSAVELNCEVGYIHYFITNLHIYENHIGKKY